VCQNDTHFVPLRQPSWLRAGPPPPYHSNCIHENTKARKHETTRGFSCFRVFGDSVFGTRAQQLHPLGVHQRELHPDE
jgi:hypothetical protein